MNFEENIGKNIFSVRKERKMTQQEVANKCGFSNTTLSSYENGKKTPGLLTLANIARALDVSIERLYYGDDSNAFINTVPDEGRKIVNAVYLLWSQGVIYYYEGIGQQTVYSDDSANVKFSMSLRIAKFSNQIRRLINGLNEFSQQRDTYDNPDIYLEMLLSSVAKEINLEINK